MKTRRLLLVIATLSIWPLVGCAAHIDSRTAVEPIAAIASPNNGDTAEIRKAKESINAKPESPAGFIQLASAYIRRSREISDHSLNKLAESAVEKALQLEPGNLSARKLKTSLLASAHNFVEARKEASALVAEIPDDSFAYGILVDANAELGNYDEAVSAAQKMVDLKPSSSSYARVGHIRSLHGDHAGAVKMLTEAARTADPQDKEAQSWCLVQLSKEYFKFGDLKKAEDIVDESLRILPDYPMALTEKGRILTAKGDYDNAEAALNKASGSVIQPAAMILLGDIRKAKGELGSATEFYRLAEENVRQTSGDIHRFALLWADHDERLDEALEIAEKDFETNKDIYASDILAWCLYKKGRFTEAKRAVSEATRLNTGDARVIYHAGMIEKALGNTRQARKLLASALKINPEFDLLQAKTAKQALIELKSN